jgi:hypothetical protein
VVAATQEEHWARFEKQEQAAALGQPDRLASFLHEMAYAPRAQHALALQDAEREQDAYADFLYSKSFQPLWPCKA